MAEYEGAQKEARDRFAEQFTGWIDRLGADPLDVSESEGLDLLQELIHWCARIRAHCGSVGAYDDAVEASQQRYEEAMEAWRKAHGGEYEAARAGIIVAAVRGWLREA